MIYDDESPRQGLPCPHCGKPVILAAPYAHPATVRTVSAPANRLQQGTIEWAQAYRLWFGKFKDIPLREVAATRAGLEYLRWGIANFTDHCVPGRSRHANSSSSTRKGVTNESRPPLALPVRSRQGHPVRRRSLPQPCRRRFCLCRQERGLVFKHVEDKHELDRLLRKFARNGNILVGFNSIRYDVPIIRAMLGGLDPYPRSVDLINGDRDTVNGIIYRDSCPRFRPDHIDLFERARKGLSRMAAAMGQPRLEELPFDPTSR